MATDFNQVSQELAQDMELLRNSIQRGSAGIDQLGSVSQATVTKIKSFGNGLEQTSSAFVKSVYSGSSALDAMATTTQSATSSVAGLAKEFGIVGKFLGFVIEKLGLIASQSLNDLNVAFKAYAEVSRQGAAGARGITEFIEQAAKMGYNVKNLNEFTALIARNSEILATFGDGMLNSVSKIANISNEFTTSGFRGELFSMGMSLEDINGGITKYARLLSITGQQDRLRGDQLTAGAKAYIKELDLLTKLTGKNAETIQSEREARLQEERMLAAQLRSEQEEAELRSQGREAEADMIKAQRENKQKLLDILPKNLATEFGALFEGLITNPQMASLMQFLPETTRYIQSGGRDMIEFSRLVNSELSKLTGKDGIGQSTALAQQFQQAFGVAFSDIVEAMRRTSRTMRGETVEAAKTAQKITDPLTQAVAHLEDVFILVQQKLQDLVRKGIGPVTTEIGKFVSQMAEYNNSPFMPVRVPPYPGGGPPPRAAPSLPGTAVPPTSTGQAQQTTPPGEAEAVSPGTYQPPSTVAPSQPARPAQPATPAAPPQGQQSQSILDLFNFGPRSGQPANVALLESGFRDRVIKAAEIYKKLTDGKQRLTVNSAFRTREDQQRLYDSATIDPLTGKRTLNGRPVAPPGNSDHERGRAIDLQQGAANDPNALAALRDAGLRRPFANDDVHFTARYGRLTSGPLGGYRATLHGNEVVIPLSNGTTIPLDMTPLIRNLDQNAQVLSEQIARLDDLITISRDSLNVNRKMLSYRS